MIYLTPALLHDIPTLVRIACESFENDPLLSLKFKIEPVTRQSEYLTELVQIWLTTGTFRVVVAKDSHLNHTPIGWTCWEHHGYTSFDCEFFNECHEIDTLGKGDVDEAVEALSPADSNFSTASTASSASSASSTSSNPSTAKLEAQLEMNMQRWASRLQSRNSKCLQLRILAVLPDHRSRPVGSRLVRWGTRGADRDSEFCWLRCPAVVMPLFAKCGFAAVGEVRFIVEDAGKWGGGEVVRGKRCCRVVYAKRKAKEDALRIEDFSRERSVVAG